jgi:hypothetical protein
MLLRSGGNSRLQSPMVAHGRAVIQPPYRDATRIYCSILLRFQKLMIEWHCCDHRQLGGPQSLARFGRIR